MVVTTRPNTSHSSRFVNHAQAINICCSCLKEHDSGPPLPAAVIGRCFVVRDHDGQALSYRLRICLLLTLGRDGALGHIA